MASELREQFIRRAYLIARLGTPYKWGGDDIYLGCDCSGLVSGLLREFKLIPDSDHNCAMLWAHFRERRTNKAAPGNLVFFRTHAWHVGICIGKDRNGEDLMIEAGGGRSSTDSVIDAINRDAKVRVSKVSRRNDRIGYVDPFKDLEG